MSHASRAPRTTRTMHHASSRRGAAVPKPILALGLVLILMAGIRLATSARSAYAQHPEPRADVTADKVMPPERYAGYPRIVEAYSLAAEIPHVLDGLYCYCNCAEHSGHRSLLSCFEEDHGAGCDICMLEAELAHRMHTQGASLEAIRDAIDEAWGGA